MSGAKLPFPVLFQGTAACTNMGEAHREAAGRQKTDSTRQTDNGEEKTGHGPCHLTEAASLAAVSPGSWAPPTTSEASAGCNIKCQQGIRHGAGCPYPGHITGGQRTSETAWLAQKCVSHNAGASRRTDISVQEATGEKMLADTGVMCAECSTPHRMA